MYSNTEDSTTSCIANESLSGRLGLIFALSIVVGLSCGNGTAGAAVVLTVKQDGAGDYTTINAALAAVPDPLADAYIIEIQDSGAYNETVSISKTTSSTNTLTLRAQAGQTPTVVVQNTYSAAIGISGTSFVTIEGIRAKGGDRAHAMSISGGSYNTIQNCTAFHTYNQGYAGIWLDNSNHNSILSNHVYDCQNGIVVFDYSSDNNTVKNNTVHDCDYRGIWLYRNCDYNVVVNNTLYSNGKEIHLGHGNHHYDPGGGNVIRNNICYARSGGYCIAVDRYGDPGGLPAGTIIDYNDYYAPGGATIGYIDTTTYSTLSAWQTGSGQDENSISSDPLFVTVPPGGASDLDIRSKEDGYASDSPCIEAGLILSSVTDDYTGASRPQGPSHDIGAYEHAATSSQPTVAVRLEVSGISDPSVAGTASDVTVRAINDVGETATGYTGAITFSSSDAAASLPANYTFQVSDNGVHTFTNGVTFNTVGEQSVTATDTSHSSITGTQSNITVSSTTIGKLKVRQDETGDYTTLQAAVDAIPAALDKPYLIEIQDNGSYWESVTISKTTSSTNTITIRAQSGKTPTIVVKKTYSAAIGLSGTSYMTIERIKAKGGDRAHAISISGGSYNTIRNCTIFHTDNQDYAGIWLHGSTYNSILSNHIYDCQNGIVIRYYGGGNNTVKNNIIHDCDNRGIWLYYPCNYNNIVNNTLYSNGREIHIGHGGAADYDPGGGNIIRNNICYARSGGYCIAVDRYGDPGGLPPGTILDYNDYYLPSGAKLAYVDTTEYLTLPAWQVGSEQDENSITSNPLFVADPPSAASDFDIKSKEDGYSSDSPCIDAGLTLSNVTDDYTGANRPQGAAHDIGAYEHAATSSQPTVAVRLEVTGIDDPSVAGTSSDVTVRAINDVGLTATGYTGTITFSSSDGAASLPANYTFQPSDNGVHTFTNGVTLNTVGEQSVTATDTSNSAITGTQSNITVTSSSICKFKVRQDETGDYTTIQAAVDAIPDVLSMPCLIEVQDNGSYWESVIITKTTSSINTITIRAQSGKTPIVVTKGKYTGTFDIDSNYVTIDGFRARGGDRANAIKIRKSYNTVKNCSAWGTTNQGFAAIYLGGVSQNTITQNKIYNSQRGIVIYNYGGDNNTITNNVIYNNTYQGIFIYRYADNNVVINNTIFGNTPGIQLGGGNKYYDPGTGNVIKNNIVQAGSGTYCIVVDWYDDRGVLPTNTVSDYNDFYAPASDAYVGIIDGATYSTLSSWKTVTSQDSNSISLNPQFEDASNDNFHLGDSSPCIGAGTSNGAPSVDIEGNPRPSPAGSNPDLGAYENSLGSPGGGGGGGGLYVELESFTAIILDGQVKLSWSTATEIDSVGFNILRSDSRNGKFDIINYALIPTRGDSFTGADYAYTDYTVTNGGAYYYMLEEFDRDGDAHLYGPVAAAPGIVSLVNPVDGGYLSLDNPVFEIAAPPGVKRLVLYVSASRAFKNRKAIRVKVRRGKSKVRLGRRAQKRLLKLASENGWALYWGVYGSAKGKRGMRPLCDASRFTVLLGAGADWQ